MGFNGTVLKRMTYVNETLEQQLLGSIFKDNTVLDDIPFIEKRDFQNINHRHIFEIMKEAYSNDLTIDFSLVLQKLNDKNIRFEGMITYLTELAGLMPSAGNAVYYAEELSKLALSKRAEYVFIEASKIKRETFESDEAYKNEIDHLIDEMMPLKEKTISDLKSWKGEYLQHLVKKSSFIKTGFQNFDMHTSGGLGRGWLYVSAGRPSVGKTAFLLQRLKGIAENNEGAVILFTQEMGRNEIIDRMIANHTGLSYSGIKTKNIDAPGKKVVLEAYDYLSTLPIEIDDSTYITINKVKETARKLKKQYGKISCIAVDYLQIMNIPQKPGETRATAIGNVTRTAKNIAREFDCCFIMLSQMSRDFENKDRPQLSHLKESGNIEQDADVVEMLWVDPEDPSENGAVVVQQSILKGRDIRRANFRLLFKGYIQRFEETRDKETNQTDGVKNARSKKRSGY